MRHLETIKTQTWQHLLIVVALALPLCSCRHLADQKVSPVTKLSDQQVAVLNGLRDEINLTYGYVDGWPRIDRGPCGRFAKLFYEKWNARFRHKVIIVFIMKTTDGGGCDHVLVKLPDWSYYDGGNGVISGATLLREFRKGNFIEEMVNYDFAVLDERSHSLKRSYELCPDYSDEVTANIIEKHLALLPKD